MSLNHVHYFFIYCSVFTLGIFLIFTHLQSDDYPKKSGQVVQRARNEILTSEFTHGISSLKSTISQNQTSSWFTSAPIIPSEVWNLANNKEEAIVSLEKKETKEVSSFSIRVVGKLNEIGETCKWMVLTILESPIIKKLLVSLDVELNSERGDPRGKMDSRGVSIFSNLPTPSEFLWVLIHEFGHVVDINRLVATTFTSDVSEEFYAISFDIHGEKKKGLGIDDFVSWYALTNRYEDFAESFAFYILHNQEFKRRSIKNTTLEKKYRFFADRIFSDWRFQGTTFETDSISEYVWDVTKIPIAVSKYLFFIR